MRAVVFLSISLLAFAQLALAADPAGRPNILLCISDDQSWAHTSAMDDPVVRTPTFDRVAREGVLFRYGFCSSPSCTPSRGALLTGQHFFRLEDGANLWSRLPPKFITYPDILEQAGYVVGHTRKGWGPPAGAESPDRPRNPAGPQFRDFDAFIETVPKDKPFCFWFGSSDPHRAYKAGSGAASGMNVRDVRVPPFLPDAPDVRNDILDYYFEVQRFDREVGEILERIAQRGELDNTIVVITSDNGFPFPRGKGTLYDYGVRMPYAIRWPAKASGGRVIDDFVHHVDLAPTFLEAAGLPVPRDMTGRSLMPLLASNRQGRVDPTRDHVIAGRERHSIRAHGTLGYPARAIRTHQWLYIQNIEPSRPAAGFPPDYGDVDGGPTKQYMLDHRDDPKIDRLATLAFDQRPAEELYLIHSDDFQMNNVIDDPDYAGVRRRLAARLDAELKRLGDPRVTGKPFDFDSSPYFGRRSVPADAPSPGKGKKK